MVYSKEKYQHALSTNDESLCSGFPKRDVIEMVSLESTVFGSLFNLFPHSSNCAHTHDDVPLFYCYDILPL